MNRPSGLHEESPLLVSADDTDHARRTSSSLSAAVVHTYVAGEDAGRLAEAAQEWGLGTPRQRRRPVRRFGNNNNSNKRAYTWWNDNTVTAARMHSVGVWGDDELEEQFGGTLRRHVKANQEKGGQPPSEVPSYGSLQNLFQQPGPELLEESANDDSEMGDEDEDDETMVPGGSLSAAVFGIIKGTVGPAVLYLPHGLQSSGYAVAIPSMIAATALYLYAAHCLLACWQKETAPNQHLTYPELARRAFANGQRRGLDLLVDVGIASMQYGVCLTYLIFVPSNLVVVAAKAFGPSSPWASSPTYWLILMTILEIPLGWMTDIRKLTPTNVLASALILYGLVSVLGMATWQGLQQVDDNHDQNSSSLVFLANARSLPALTDAWFLFVGTSFFMMEGSITLLVPLQEAVYRPRDRARFPGVNQQVATGIVSTYLVFALVCVLGLSTCYDPSSTQTLPTALTAALPTTTGWWTPSIQAAYAIAVLLTFPLQAFPATQVTGKLLLGSSRVPSKDPNDLPTAISTKRSWWQYHKRQVLSTVVTIGLGLVAHVAIDYLGNVVSILGSLFGIPLALIFPPLMHNRLVLDASDNSTNNSDTGEQGLSIKHKTAVRMMNYAVVVLGIGAMLVTSVATAVTWNEGAE